MPVAPKVHGLSSRIEESITSNAPAPTASFLPAQSQHWTTDVGTGAYDVIPVDYHGSELARYQAPFDASNEQPYVVQSGGPLDAPIFTSNAIVAGVVAHDQSPGSFHSHSTNHPSFYFDVVEPYQQQDDRLIDLATTHSNKEHNTTSRSFSERPQVAQDNSRPTSIGLQRSPALAAAGKGSQPQAPALLRGSLKKKAASTPFPAIRDSRGHPPGRTREAEDRELRERMANSTRQPVTSSPNSSHDPGSGDQPATKATDSSPSDAASASGDDVERNRSGGGLVSVGAQRTGSNVGANPPPGIVQAGSIQQAPHTPFALPAEKVFPIQIGSELFRLSGASIASDGEYPTSKTSLRNYVKTELRILEHPRTSPNSSWTSYVTMKMELPA